MDLNAWILFLLSLLVFSNILNYFNDKKIAKKINDLKQEIKELKDGK